jgi:hypothetical protein
LCIPPTNLDSSPHLLEQKDDLLRSGRNLTADAESF